MTAPEIEIELDLDPIRYKIEVQDPKNVDKEIKKLKSFILVNDEKLNSMRSEVLEARRKNSAKLSESVPVDCRLPDWFYKVKPTLSQAVALLLYFANKPLNTRQLTTLVNAEIKGKKKDLRNVSQHVTSKGKSLYGQTAYDKISQTYALNDYGKMWVEGTLIPELTKKLESNLTSGRNSVLVSS